MSDSTVYVVFLHLPEFDFMPVVLGVFTTFEKALELKEKLSQALGILRKERFLRISEVPKLNIGMLQL